jgi:hypothetical protein
MKIFGAGRGPTEPIGGSAPEWNYGTTGMSSDIFLVFFLKAKLTPEIIEFETNVKYTWISILKTITLG